MESNDHVFIGVDFGTTNVVVATVLKPDEGDPAFMPPTTCISLNYPATCLLDLEFFPDAALPLSAKSDTPPMEIFEIKKFLGQTSANADLINTEGKYGYDLHNLHIRAGGVAARPERIAAEIAKSIVKHHAPDQETVHAVVTVPAYFNDAQRRATKDALSQAGIHVVSLLNEPTAAALTYASKIPANSKMLVVDIGGGTTDVSAVQKGEEDLHVKGTSGDPHVGGQEIDRIIVEMILKRKAAFTAITKKKVKNASKTSTPQKPNANTRAAMMSEARRVKEYLSRHRQCDFRLHHFNEQEIHMEERVTVEQLNAAITATCQQIVVHIEESLRLAEWNPEEIQTLLLVGGATRIPLLQQIAIAELPNATILKDVNADFAIAQGAALYMESIKHSIKIDRQSPTPVPTTAIAPIHDILGKSMGLALTADMFSIILPKGVSLPATRIRHYQTSADFQRLVSLEVLQGTASLASKNTLIGVFELPVMPRLRGEIQIKVTFALSPDGCLDIKAEELNGLNNSKKIAIKKNDTNASALEAAPQ